MGGVSDIRGRPPFFLCVGRTSVRYKGIRCNCVRVVYISRWCRSVLRVRVIFSHGGEGREPLAGPMVGFQYISCRLVSSVSLLRLVAASRPCVSFVLLVFSSRRRLFVVASCRFIFSVLSRFCLCVLLVADAVVMSSVWRLMSVALVVSVSCPCILFIVYLIVVFRPVPSPRVSFRQSPRSHSVPFCSCRHPWRGGGSGGAWRGCPCCYVIRAMAFCFRISDWLGGEREWG